MGNNPIKKLSVIGLILIAISSAMASIFPSQSIGLQIEGANDGTLRVTDTNDGMTCDPDEPEDEIYSCNISESLTTFLNLDKYKGVVFSNQTVENTSMSAEKINTSLID